MIEWLGPDHATSTTRRTEGYCSPSIDSEEWLAHPGSVGRPLIGTAPHPRRGRQRAARPASRDRLLEGGAGVRVPQRPGEDGRVAQRARAGPRVGDIGYLDEDGYLYLTDRKADMIISGGVNIYPQEAENVLVTHPAVADAAVFGIPHDELGEEVKAVVQPIAADRRPAEVEAELLAYCHERLAKYKCPRSIDFAEALPRHPTGKLYKRLLRDRYADASR